MSDTGCRIIKMRLIHEMVNEFAELQGIMGRYYALSDEDEEVAAAMYEQYQPGFAGDVDSSR